MNSLTKGIVGGLAGLMLLSSLAGCSAFNLSQSMHFDLDKPFPWEADEAEVQVPTRMAVVWHDTVLNQRRRRGVRGFGARVMFYNDESDKPIRVEGDIAVYAFDNTTAVEADAKPDRKYVFKHEQLEKHYSKSGLGHSYSFWVPWDEVGGEPRKIDLMLSFEDMTGAKIQSDSTRQKLPGISKGMLAGKAKSEQTQTAEVAKVSGAIQQIGFTEAAAGASGESSYKQQMKTETIEVTKSFADNYIQGNDWEAPESKSKFKEVYGLEPPPFEEDAGATEINSENEKETLPKKGVGLFEHRKSLSEKYAESEESLKARYAQHRLQAQTSRFAMPNRVPGKSLPNRPGVQSAPSLLEQSIRQTQTLEMTATAPASLGSFQ